MLKTSKRSFLKMQNKSDPSRESSGTPLLHIGVAARVIHSFKLFSVFGVIDQYFEHAASCSNISHFRQKLMAENVVEGFWEVGIENFSLWIYVLIKNFLKHLRKIAWLRRLTFPFLNHVNRFKTFKFLHEELWLIFPKFCSHFRSESSVVFYPTSVLFFVDFSDSSLFRGCWNFP